MWLSPSWQRRREGGCGAGGVLLGAREEANKQNDSLQTASKSGTDAPADDQKDGAADG